MQAIQEFFHVCVAVNKGQRQEPDCTGDAISSTDLVPKAEHVFVFNSELGSRSQIGADSAYMSFQHSVYIKCLIGLSGVIVKNILATSVCVENSLSSRESLAHDQK